MKLRILDLPPLIHETERYLSGFTGDAHFMAGCATSFRLKSYLRLGADFPAAQYAAIHFTLENPPRRGGDR